MVMHLLNGRIGFQRCKIALAGDKPDSVGLLLGIVSVTAVSLCRRSLTCSRTLDFLELVNGSVTCKLTFQITARFIPIFISLLTRRDLNRLKASINLHFG